MNTFRCHDKDSDTNYFQVKILCLQKYTNFPCYQNHKTKLSKSSLHKFSYQMVPELFTHKPLALIKNIPQTLFGRPLDALKERYLLLSKSTQNNHEKIPITTNQHNCFTPNLIHQWIHWE